MNLDTADIACHLPLGMWRAIPALIAVCCKGLVDEPFGRHSINFL
jgi:hypothetical protein